MNKSLVTFALGLIAGAAAGVLLSAWLNEQDMGKVQEKFSAKTDALRDELADQIEALKEKLENNRQSL